MAVKASSHLRPLVLFCFDIRVPNAFSASSYVSPGMLQGEQGF